MTNVKSDKTNPTARSWSHHDVLKATSVGTVRAATPFKHWLGHTFVASNALNVFSVLAAKPLHARHLWKNKCGLNLSSA